MTKILLEKLNLLTIDPISAEQRSTFAISIGDPIQILLLEEIFLTRKSCKTAHRQFLGLCRNQLRERGKFRLQFVSIIAFRVQLFLYPLTTRRQCRLATV